MANAFAKVSLVAFIMTISPQRRITTSCYTILAIVAGWTLSGVFARAFQCRLPQPWLHVEGKCNDEKALSLYLGIVNIITDLALIAVPWVMMVSLPRNGFYALRYLSQFTIRVMKIADVLWAKSRRRYKQTLLESGRLCLYSALESCELDVYSVPTFD